MACEQQRAVHSDYDCCMCLLAVMIAASQQAMKQASKIHSRADVVQRLTQAFDKDTATAKVLIVHETIVTSQTVTVMIISEATCRDG
jgi:hypothetical protein